MARTLDDFEDILEPRRREITNWTWALRPLNALSPCERNKKISPEQIKLEVLNSPKILGLIDRASQKDIPRELIVSKIKEILDEIGYSRKLWVIRTLGYFLSLINTRVLRGIFVNKESITNLKHRMGDVPIMYVPSHRSYADFILMSYLLFFYDIDIPAIAAGMDFHAMKGMGTILRNTGAFFMRRSYNSDGLYWDTFREYVHQLVIKGDKGIEFFVEGTRSRTGKTLYPKFGLLTMILKAFFNSELPDILFVPVNLSYDRVMEERLFTFELLGVPKPKETTSGFFKSLHIVQEDFGNVYVNFGEPISTFEFFNNKIDRSVHSLNSVHAQITTDLERKATALLAQKIVESQQKLCVITTFNLIATMFINNLIMHQEAVNLDKLFCEVKWLDEILRALTAITDFNGTIQRILDDISVHNNVIQINSNGDIHLVQDPIVLGNFDKEKLKGYPLSEETMTKAVPLVMLQLYVNPILHYFVNPALMVLVLRCNSLEMHTDRLFEEFSFLRSMLTREFVLFPENSTRDYAESMKLLGKLNVLEAKGNTIALSTNEKLLNFLFGVLEPFFHSYYILCCVLMNVSKVRFDEKSEKDIISDVQCQIERLLDNRTHPYSLSLDTISNCLQNLVDLKVLHKTKRGDVFYYGGSLDGVGNIKNRICEYMLHLPMEISPHMTCKL